MSGRAGHLADEDLVVWEDGSATGDRRRRIESHLATCAACQRRLEEFREVGRILRRHYPLVDDPKARERLMAELGGRERAAAGGEDVATTALPWLRAAGAAVRAGLARGGRSLLRALDRGRRGRSDR